jgi:DNA helicase-2/ATP-dependent DNA helicase PcrA
MKDFILDITKEYKCCTNDIRDLCNDLGLDGKEEHNDEGARIELSTVHGYKGLEKDVVIMPWTQSYLDKVMFKSNIEEERRLFYVAVTRAKEKLIMSYSGEKPQFIKEME